MKTKVIAFPYAGGNRFSYRIIEKHMPDNFEWISIELTSKVRNTSRKKIVSLNHIIDRIVSEVKEHVSDNSRYFFYGHSLGTVIAYEVAKKIIALGIGKFPDLLFLTGRIGPSCNLIKKVSCLDNNSFWQEMKQMGGFSQKLLINTDFREYIEPILREDIRLLENYQYYKPCQRMSIPFYIRMGKEENNYSLENVNSWQFETTLPIDFQTREGGHFFIFERPQELANDIVQAFKSCTI